MNQANTFSKHQMELLPKPQNLNSEGFILNTNHVWRQRRGHKDTVKTILTYNRLLERGAIPDTGLPKEQSLGFVACVK
jgi:hypothetical protein